MRPMWRYLLVDPIRPLLSCSSGFCEVKLAVKFALSLLFPVALWGVYAPIPEQDQGYLFMVSLEGGADLIPIYSGLRRTNWIAF